MKTNFVQRAYNIATEAREFIKVNVTIRKEFTFHQLSNGEISEEEHCLLLDLPTFNYVDRRGENQQYAILSIFKKNDDIFVSAFNAETEAKSFFIFKEQGLIDDATACWIADLISNQLNEVGD